MKGMTFADWLGEVPAGFDGERMRRLEALLEQEPSLRHLARNIMELGSPPVSLLGELVGRFRAFRSFRSKVLSSPLDHEAAWACRSMAGLELGETVAAALPGLAHAALADCAAALLALALKEGHVRATPLPSAPDDALALSGELAVAELPSQRWLAWRRQERAGHLRVEPGLSADRLQAQIEAREARYREPMVYAYSSALPAAVKRALDERALDEASALAAAAYRGLLTQPPVREPRLGALFVGAVRQPLGAVVIAGDGTVETSRSFPADRGWEMPFQRWISERKVRLWVVPSGAVDAPRLAAASRLLGTGTLPVRPAGLSAARSALEASSFPREQLSALILGRRALHPLEEWGAVDPLEIGLAEYQHDLDEAPLRERLSDVLTQVQLERKAAAAGGHSAPTSPLQAGPASRLNPLIRSLADLRVGMLLEVQVTNLASFGAFVTFGLDIEGLIHLSQLSDRRISSPAEIVAIGQRVRARVVEVDLIRKRVGFSLRHADPGGSARSPRGKAEALKKLEQLFRRD